MLVILRITYVGKIRPPLIATSRAVSLNAISDVVAIPTGAKMRLLLTGLLLIFAGCATPYQEMGFSGGVTAAQMTDTTFRISGRGNGYTGATVINDYVMLKAAETTVQHGYTHFMVVSAADASSSATIVTGGTSRTTFVGNSAMTTYSPPVAQNIYKPGEDAFIRVIKIEPGQAPPQGAIAADEIIRHVGSRVKRTS